MKKMKYFDDCPVCQAMKKAQEEGRTLSLAELRKAFILAEGLGVVIGGDWIEHGGKE